MGTANQGACRAAAAGKGCPSNGEGSIQETNPTPRRKMIAFTWLLANRVTGRRKRHRQGELRAQAVVTSSHLSEEETEEKEHSTLNLLVCVNRKNRPFNMNPLVGIEEAGTPAFTSPYETICQEGRKPHTGALNSSRWLSFAQPGDKDHLLPIYWQRSFTSQLELLKRCKLPLPKPLSDIC